MAATLAHPKAFAVWFKDLARWDIKTAKAVQFNHAHPAFRPLKEFAEEVTKLVRPWEEPDKEWPVYGVNNETGVFFSHKQKGIAFNAPYKRICKDWFFHNPTRANVGSLGRVPAVPPDAITSPEYQVWRICGDLTPDFMGVLLSTEFFHNQIEFHRVGAVKQRLFTENLLQIRIPILPIQSQTAIVGRWRKAQAEADASRDTIAKLEADIQIDMYKVLGMKPPRTDIGVPKVFGVWWKNIERWSLSFNQQAIHRPDPNSGRYPTAPLGSLIQDLENGWSPKCHNRPATSAEWGVLKLGAISFGTFDPHENKALPSPLKPDLHLEVKTGDVLITRANITRLVGACAVVSETRPRLLLCDKIFRVIFKPDSKILSGYLTEIMKTPHLRHQIENAVTGTSPTMKNITKTSLLRLLLPLPPLDIQHKLVDSLKDQRMRIAEERKAAEVRHAQAARDVEEMILGRL